MAGLRTSALTTRPRTPRCCTGTLDQCCRKPVAAAMSPSLLYAAGFSSSPRSNRDSRTSLKTTESLVMARWLSRSVPTRQSQRSYAPAFHHSVHYADASNSRPAASKSASSRVSARGEPRQPSSSRIVRGERLKLPVHSERSRRCACGGWRNDSRPTSPIGDRPSSPRLKVPSGLRHLVKQRSLSSASGGGAGRATTNSRGSLQTARSLE
jgi:hypothetical protein